jgi:hypothetical protein
MDSTAGLINLEAVGINTTLPALKKLTQISKCPSRLHVQVSVLDSEKIYLSFDKTSLNVQKTVARLCDKLGLLSSAPAGARTARPFVDVNQFQYVFFNCAPIEYASVRP